MSMKRTCPISNFGSIVKSADMADFRRYQKSLDFRSSPLARAPMALMTSGKHKPTKSDSRTRRTPERLAKQSWPARISHAVLSECGESSLRFCPDTRYLARDRQLQKFVNFIRDYFYLVHDRNQRLIAHPFLFKLQRGHHAIDQADCHAIG